MLHPNNRSLYTDALTPPPGYIFDQAIGTTYTLDPTTLLTIPVHLGLAMRRKGVDDNPVDLLGALHRVAGQITVYAQCGRMQVPNSARELFSLLEPMIVEASSRGGGAFHPKVWVLRFREPDGDAPIFRLLVLSRNLTNDRSWDLCLQLEGKPTRKDRAANQPLSEFIRALPSFSVNAVGKRKRDQARDLAAEISRTRWNLPEDFDEVRFHYIHGKSWLPAQSDRLAVVSPFITVHALKALAGTARKAETLVSRMEELDNLTSDPDEIFGQVAVLIDAAESDDGEDMSERDMFGLHAKAFVAEKRDKVRVYVGSANATTSAIVEGRNVEFLAELIGKQVGGIDKLFGEEGIGEYIEPWEASGESAENQEEKEAEKVLDRVREALAGAKLRVECTETADGGRWQLALRGNTAIDLAGVRAFRAWPITVRDEHASDILSAMGQKVINLGTYSLQSVTGLIAFEVASELENKKVRFTLNLPLDGLPKERNAAILRAVVKDSKGFMRYLLLLLGELDGGVGIGANGTGLGANGRWSVGQWDTLPLLEEMTRSFSRDPARLHEIRNAVKWLGSPADSTDIVSEEFRALWKIFDKALSGRGK